MRVTYDVQYRLIALLTGSLIVIALDVGDWSYLLALLTGWVFGALFMRALIRDADQWRL